VPRQAVLLPSMLRTHGAGWTRRWKRNNLSLYAVLYGCHKLVLRVVCLRMLRAEGYIVSNTTYGSLLFQSIWIWTHPHKNTVFLSQYVQETLPTTKAVSSFHPKVLQSPDRCFSSWWRIPERTRRPTPASIAACASCFRPACSSSCQ